MCSSVQDLRIAIGGRGRKTGSDELGADTLRYCGEVRFIQLLPRYVHTALFVGLEFSPIYTPQTLPSLSVFHCYVGIKASASFDPIF